jgi:hypothetical protein
VRTSRPCSSTGRKLRWPSFRIPSAPPRIKYYIRLLLSWARIIASFPRLVADAFFAHPVETISRPFSAAFGPRVSKSTFGGTGVSDCSIPRNHLSVLTSPSEVAIFHGNNGLSVAEQACALRRSIVRRGAQSAGPGMESKGRAGGLRES